MEAESTGIKWIYDLLGWLDVHRKQALAGFVGFVILVILIYAYAWHRKQVRLQAGAALVQLMNRMGEDTSSVKPEDFLALARKYKGTPAAERALLTAAFQYFKKDDYANAQKLFRQFMEKYPDSIWTPNAALGLAACLDAQNKIQEAEQAYNQVIQDYGNHPAAAQARLKLATLYESTGRFSKALALYNELSNLKLFGRVAQLAMQRREELLREHPELTPPPPKQTNQVQTVYECPCRPTANDQGRPILHQCRCSCKNERPIQTETHGHNGHQSPFPKDLENFLNESFFQNFFYEPGPCRRTVAVNS